MNSNNNLKNSKISRFCKKMIDKSSFNENLEKSKKNRVRENITNVDSLGNELSQEQINYFKNSKVVDSKGNLLVVYHGSPNAGFKEFNPKDNKSQFGKYKFDKYNVNYFTTNKKAAASYTDMGYDDGTVYECYLNIVNPYIIDMKSDDGQLRTFRDIEDSNVRKKQANLFERIFNKWKNKIIYYTDNEFQELNRDLNKINYELRPSQDYEEGTAPEDIEYFDLWFLGNNSFLGNEYPQFYQYSTDELFSDEMYDEMKERIVGSDEDEFHFYSTDEVVRYVLAMNEDDNTNYDGVIIKNIFDSKDKFSGSGTTIITLISSNQIKSITNKQPSNSNRIDETNLNEDLIVRYKGKNKNKKLEEDDDVVLQDEQEDDIMIDDTVENDKPLDLSRNTEILSLIYKQTHIRNDKGGVMPSYCFVDEIMNVYGLSQERVVDIALKNNYKIMKVFPNETVDGGLLIADKGCSSSHIKTDYEKFYGVEVEVEDYKG